MYSGKKVKLRAYRREDLTLLCEYLNDEELNKLLVNRIPYPPSLEQQEKWFESLMDSKDSYSFAIEALDSGNYIGGCTINKINGLNRTVTVGIFIGPKDYWGKGYGRDAMEVLIKFIFDEMNMNKIKLNVFSFNERAKICYEKCGFKVEGILRQELFRNGRYWDEYAMGLLAEEWRRNIRVNE